MRTLDRKIKMIHIVLINVLSKEYSTEYYYVKRFPRHEFTFLCDMDNKNCPLYVLPHGNSLLKEFFIDPCLDENGYIRESCYGKVMKTKMLGREFKYDITRSRSLDNFKQKKQ